MFALPGLSNETNFVALLPAPRVPADLNNAIYRTHGRFDNQQPAVVEYGAALTLGARATAPLDRRPEMRQASLQRRCNRGFPEVA